jgi:hypothetical protein
MTPTHNAHSRRSPLFNKDEIEVQYSPTEHNLPRFSNRFSNINFYPFQETSTKKERYFRPMMCIDRNNTYLCRHDSYVKEKCHPRRAEDLRSCPGYGGVKPARPFKKYLGCTLNDKVLSRECGDRGSRSRY